MVGFVFIYSVDRDLPNGSVVVNSVTGEMEELEVKKDLKILSDRERQVLRLIDKGLMSKNKQKDFRSVSIRSAGTGKRFSVSFRLRIPSRLVGLLKI